jgi:hypothetical protein
MGFSAFGLAFIAFPVATVNPVNPSTLKKSRRCRSIAGIVLEVEISQDTHNGQSPEIHMEFFTLWPSSERNPSLHPPSASHMLNSALGFRFIARNH